MPPIANTSRVLTQKTIIRLITFPKHLTHTEPILKLLNIIPLNNLYYYII